MRKYIFCLALLAAGGALAEDLGDVNKLLDAKAYPQAIAMLVRLSDAGNASAQLRLGQMYWYGEGTAVDRARADALFAKAAAAGNQDAAGAMGLTAARQQHLADIEYWTAKYDGADLTSGAFNCPAPALPERSTTNEAIKATTDAVSGWKTCYNGFVRNLGDAMPAGKRIPAAVADVMTDVELERAKAHLGEVYGRAAASAKAGADRTLAAFASWQKSTDDYVHEQNAARAMQARDEVERRLKTEAAAVHPAPPVVRTR
jgi:TPR repeat protein